MTTRPYEYRGPGTDGTNIIGLQGGRHPRCKICVGILDDDILQQACIDVATKRLNFKQFKSTYESYILEQGLVELNASNVSSHKKHCDIQNLVTQHLRAEGKSAKKADIIQSLLGEMWEEALDRQGLIEKLYKDRIRNLALLFDQREVLQRQYDLWKDDPVSGDIIMPRIRNLEKEIAVIESDLLKHLIKEETAHVRSKSGGPSITILNILNTNLESFVTEMVQIVHMALPEQQERAGEIVQKIALRLDVHTSMLKPEDNRPPHLRELHETIQEL